VARLEDPFALHEGAAETWDFVRDRVLEAGVVDQSLKALALRYVGDPDAIDVERYAGRERAALDWAYAIVWDADAANDELWARLHELFSEEELVDLGCAVGFELGRTHFLRTLGHGTPGAAAHAAATR
jgi:alkylhydroperoxidase family enzyme